MQNEQTQVVQYSTTPLAQFGNRWEQLKKSAQQLTQNQKESAEAQIIGALTTQIAKISPLEAYTGHKLSSVRALQGQAKESALQELTAIFELMFRNLELWYGKKWELGHPLKKQQVIAMIREKYYFFSVMEVARVFKSGMAGEYGKSYHTVDGETLMNWLHEYNVNERQALSERANANLRKEPDPLLLEAPEQTPEQRAKMQAALDNLKAPKKPDTNTKPDIRQAAYRGAMAALTEEQRAKVQRWKAATSVDDGPQTEQEQMLWVQFHEDVSERMATASTRENERYQKYSQWLGRFKDGQAPTFQEFEKMFV